MKARALSLLTLSPWATVSVLNALIPVSEIQSISHLIGASVS